MVATTVIVHLASDGITDFSPEPKSISVSLIDTKGEEHPLGTADVQLKCSNNPLYFNVMHDLSKPFFRTKGMYSYTSINAFVSLCICSGSALTCVVSWMKKRMDMQREVKYYMLSAGLMPGVPDKPSARGHVGTRTNQGSRIDYITEKPYLHHQLGVPRSPIFGLLAAISWHWLRLACSGWPAGF